MRVGVFLGTFGNLGVNGRQFTLQLFQCGNDVVGPRLQFGDFVHGVTIVRLSCAAAQLYIHAFASGSLDQS